MNVKVNMSFPNSNFEGNISTYLFGKSFCHYRDLKLNVGHRDIYIAKKKILNYFVCVEVRILVKSEICMKITFSRGHYNKHAYWKRLLCV